MSCCAGVMPRLRAVSGNRIARTLVGVLVGMVLGVVELAFLCLAWPTSLIAATRPAADRGLARLVALERARLARWLGHDTTRTAGGYGFLAARAALGVLGGYGCAAGLFLGGLLLFGGLWDLLWGESEAVPVNLPGVKLVTTSGILGLTSAGALLALVTLGVLAVGAVARRLADHFLGPGRQELMRRRIAELTATRAGIVRAVDDERRRIERDLHDGVQQRGWRWPCCSAVPSTAPTRPGPPSWWARPTPSRVGSSTSYAVWPGGSIRPHSTSWACAPRSRASPNGRACR